MNVLAQKWVEALRSGRFAQGRCALNTGNRFCCLGVACELFVPESQKLKTVDGVGYINRFGKLPDPLVQALGLRTNGGAFESQRFGRTSLVNLNDGGRTFAEIADIIESEPEGLFV